MTQTTLSVDDTSDVIDALRKRFTKIVGPRKDDICYATTNRQEAVRALAEQAEGWWSVSKTSNLQPFMELAQRMGKRAFLIDDAKDIQEEWVKEVKCVGVTAGASAPISLQKWWHVGSSCGGEAIPAEKAVKKTLFRAEERAAVDIWSIAVNSSLVMVKSGLVTGIFYGENMRLSIFLDSDPGIDDAVAIASAILHPNSTCN